MRPFEFLQLALTIFTAGGAILSRRIPALRPWLRYVAAAMSLTIPLQLLIEGYRWQNVLTYLCAIIAAFLAWRQSRSSQANPSHTGHKAIATVGGAILSLLLIISTALPILFPVPVMPKPSGKYAIGTASFYLKDPSRDEIYTDDPNDKRQIMMQIWYPAKSTAGAQPAKWLDRLDIAGPIIAQRLNLPSFVLDHANLTQSNSFLNTPIIDDSATLPVVVYSHGWTGFRTVNMNQSEDLASHGYIVVSIDHSYGSMITVFPDGSVAPLKASILPPDGSPDFTPKFTQLVGVYAADVQFVLDQLALLNQGDAKAQAVAPWLKGRLDLSRLGLMGHSTGGAAITRVCATDARCKAGFGMDVAATGLTSDITAKGFQQPFFALWSEQWRGNNSDKLFALMFTQAKNPIYRAYISGAKHYDFIMISLLSPLASTLGLKGPINGERMMRLNDDYLLAFFDQHLRGSTSPLLAAASPLYPEVAFEKQ